MQHVIVKLFASIIGVWTFSLAACTFPSSKLASKITLDQAIKTLPASALGNMDFKSRDKYIRNPVGMYSPKERRVHVYGDNSEINGDSMVFLRIFEDEQGSTIAASHATRPFSLGSSPNNEDTQVFRFTDRGWEDISNIAFSSEVLRNWYFRFDHSGELVPYGEYIVKKRADGRGNFYDFASSRGSVIWRGGQFRISK